MKHPSSSGCLYSHHSILFWILRGCQKYDILHEIWECLLAEMTWYRPRGVCIIHHERFQSSLYIVIRLWSIHTTIGVSPKSIASWFRLFLSCISKFDVLVYDVGFGTIRRIERHRIGIVIHFGEKKQPCANNFGHLFYNTQSSNLFSYMHGRYIATLYHFQYPFFLLVYFYSDSAQVHHHHDNNGYVYGLRFQHSTELGLAISVWRFGLNRYTGGWTIAALPCDI